MPIKAIEIFSVEAKRFVKRGAKMPPNINIQQNIQITQVTVIDEKQLNIEFRFNTQYSGGMGHINIEGRILYDGDAPALSRQWSSENKMPDDVIKEVHQAIFKGCVPAAVALARETGLHPPIPLPQVQIGKKPTTVPSSGMEVA